MKGCKGIMLGRGQLQEALRSDGEPGTRSQVRTVWSAPMRQAPVAAHCECRPAGACCGWSEEHRRAPSVAARSAVSTRRLKWNFVHIGRFKRAGLLGFFGGWKMVRDPIENTLGSFRIPKGSAAAGCARF